MAISREKLSDQRTTYVYEALNLVNGKRYIGVTSKNLKQRRYEHEWAAQRKTPGCRVFYAALRKYGPDNFHWSIVSRHETYADGLQAEISLIASLRPEYNITSGGQGVAGVPWGPERRAKVSAANKGRKITAQQLANMRAALRPELRYKSVLCLEDGRLFESVKAAAAAYYDRADKRRLGARSLSEALRGKQLRYAGKHFIFSNKTLSAEECEREIQRIEGGRKDRIALCRAARSRPVVCVNDGRVFSSGAEAARAVGLSVMRVSQLCRLGGKTSDGLQFRFADAELVQAPVRTAEQQAIAREMQKKALARAQEKHRKEVICLDTGDVYASITEAAAAGGCSIQAISDCCRSRGGVKAVFGRRYAFVDPATSSAVPWEKAPRRVSRGVLCLDDGRPFRTAQEAASFYGAPLTGILQMCSGNAIRNAVAGRRFVYLGV